MIAATAVFMKHWSGSFFKAPYGTDEDAISTRRSIAKSDVDQRMRKTGWLSGPMPGSCLLLQEGRSLLGHVAMTGAAGSMYDCGQQQSIMVTDNFGSWGGSSKDTPPSLCLPLVCAAGTQTLASVGLCKLSRKHEASAFSWGNNQDNQTNDTLAASRATPTSHRNFHLEAGSATIPNIRLGPVNDASST